VSQGVYDRNAAVTLATIQPAVLDIYAGGTAQPQAIACIGTYAVCSRLCVASLNEKADALTLGRTFAQQIVIFIQIWRSLAASGCTYCRDTTFVMGTQSRSPPTPPFHDYHHHRRLEARQNDLSSL
jgi:hypothetical protein